MAKQTKTKVICVSILLDDITFLKKNDISATGLLRYAVGLARKNVARKEKEKLVQSNQELINGLVDQKTDEQNVGVRK